MNKIKSPAEHVEHPDIICNQLGPDQAKHGACYGSKLFDTLMLFLKQTYVTKNKHANKELMKPM